MSIFGAMDTAVSGLGSQSAAFSNISDNVANSQTVGFKRVDTSFEDYLTYSSADDNQSGSVVARPDYINSVQGTIAQTDNPLAMAISGNGFFSVSSADTSSTGVSTFNPVQQYTRDGSFSLDKQGYLQNDVGNYLNGWPVNAAGTVTTTTLSPIQINQQAVFQPVPTANIGMSANLPANSTTPITTNITVYDAEGQAHQLAATFTPKAPDTSTTPATTFPNTWDVTVADENNQPLTLPAQTPPNAAGNVSSPIEVVFNANGTLQSLAQNGTVNNATTPASWTYPTTDSTVGDAANVTLATNYPAEGGATYQNITLNMGAVGGSSGLSQFAGSAFTLNSVTQDGIPPGTFSGVTATSTGDIIVNYSNGQSNRVAQVPVTTFNAPDALQRQDGQSFTASPDSGAPLTQAAGAGNAGGLVTGATEASNVDISTEFTKLIMAQQSYSANAKVITSANQLLQTTISMVS